MNVIGIRWVGIRTERDEEMAALLRDGLEQAGAELLGQIERDQHGSGLKVRAPDENRYEAASMRSAE